MSERRIILNRKGYEPFFDFLKAFAILSVLLGHTFPYLDETGYSLWYGMQVPIFVLIQSFHVLKRTEYSLNAAKVFRRIVLPYLLVQTIAFILYLIRGEGADQLIHRFIIDGGCGPGSYYPWVYLQIAITLVLLRPIMKSKSKGCLAFFFVLACESFEIVTSLIGIPESIYRLLALRYVFLIYLGWLWVKEGIVLNRKTIMLSLLSLGAIVYFEYFYTPTEPWFYNTGWKTHRWPCYFYVSTMLVSLLYLIYDKIKSKESVMGVVSTLARCSYEIFLCQMIIIPLMPDTNFIQNQVIRFVLKFICIWLLSIIGGYYFNILYNRRLRKK